MPINFGTLELLDTLAVIDNATVYEYGEDRLYENIRDLLDVHNQLTADIASAFAGNTTDRVSRLGADTVGGEMIEVDEFGFTDVQKTAVAGYDIGWPLRRYQYGIGWTRRYFQLHRPSDLAKEYVAAAEADVKNIRLRMMQALFRATNYTFVDREVDNVSLPVKALINADGSDIPMGPYGSTFDGATHTHLVGRAGGALAASDISALIDNVTEHGVSSGRVVVYINSAQEAAVRAFTSNFSPFQAPLLSPGPGSTDDIVAGGRKENYYQIDDKPIGIWDGFVEVWMKPWMPANYIMAHLIDGGDGPVLRRRTRGVAGFGDYQLVYEHEHYPLRSQHFEREFGFGVWNRFAAAILYSGGTSYVTPSFAFV